MNIPSPSATIYAALAFLLLFASGCDRQPARVEMPSLNPSAIGKGAMKKYDANGDGAVEGEELENAGSLQDHPDAQQKRIDHNNDGKVTADEVKARVDRWIELKTSIMSSPPIIVTLDGKPLAGATVRFVPEPFMNGAVEEASGVTTNTGSVVLAIDDEKLPSDLKGFSGMRPGFYMVEITHPTQKIPPRYNTQTMLGHEVAGDLGPENIEFNLKSR